jgi:alkanesulfonate monooxygenase SsuD/methylene tetrahydromethanopterin reductase-like flavin-dependent oxidoreductase (luciferase family)
MAARPLDFGMALPNCREGVLYRPGSGFGTVAGIDRFALAAEAQGFRSVWVDDHLTDRPRPADGPDPGLLEATMVLAHVATLTSRVRVGASVFALPLREPVLLARQTIALDHISGGRAVLGVGIGNLEEFRTVRPAESKMHRWNGTIDRLSAIRDLITTGATESGRPFSDFGLVRMHPGPLQAALPIHVATGVTNNLAQLVDVADGWHSLGQSLPDFAANVAVVRAALAARSGPEREFEIIPSFHLRLAADRRSGYEQALSCAAALPWKDNPDHPVNLFGSPQDIAERLAGYHDAGASECIISFLATGLDDAEAQIAQFTAEVMPHFAVQ